jgi:hypothetical protein
VTPRARSLNGSFNRITLQQQQSALHAFVSPCPTKIPQPASGPPLPEADGGRRGGECKAREDVVVLCADDELLNRKIITRFLRRCKLSPSNCSIVEDGEDLIELIEPRMCGDKDEAIDVQVRCMRSRYE